jgi:hypothetical protein
MSVMFFFVVVAGPLAAEDLPDPAAFRNPLVNARDTGLFSGATHQLFYENNVFRSVESDLFKIGQRSSFTFFSNERFAFSAAYGSFLFVGPVAGPVAPGSPLAPWLMQAVQFEYGVVGAVFVPVVSSSVTVGYGRTSQHPLLGTFSEVSSDVVEIGVWPELSFLEFHNASIHPSLLIAFIDLFDFWQSPLRAPRTALRVEPMISAELSVINQIAVFANLYPRVLFLRTTGQWPYADVDPPVQMELYAEAGVRFAHTAETELYLYLVSTEDSERLRGEPSPTFVAGVGVRFGAGRLARR